MWNHWTLRACTPYKPFKDFQTASAVWNALRENFPDALAAILMPNHLHLILPAKTESKTRRRFAGIMGPVSKSCEVSGLWQPMPPPAQIPDRLHLRRQIRYVALNPCRSDLCSDPLEWIWSTYRDVMGATVNPWVNAETIVEVLNERQKGFAVRFHAYVSGDPSVAIEGTKPPVAATSKPWPFESIGEILYAAAATLQVPPSQVQNRSALRDLFVQLAFRQGWRQVPALAQTCRTTTRAIHYILEKPPNASALSAAALCLGDERLRKEFRSMKVDLGEELQVKRKALIRGGE